MNKHLTWSLASLYAALCLFSTGCGKQEETSPGPAEQLGRELDRTMRQAVEKAQEVQKQLEERFEQGEKEPAQEE